MFHFIFTHETLEKMNPAAPAGYFELIAAFWPRNLTRLDILGWKVSQDWNLMGRAREFTQNLQPQRSIREIAFSCSLYAASDHTDGFRDHMATRCNCNQQILLDMLKKLPRLETLHYTLDEEATSKLTVYEEVYDEHFGHVQVPIPDEACGNEPSLKYLAKALSEHTRIKSLHLSGYAYQTLFGISRLGFTRAQG